MAGEQRIGVVSDSHGLVRPEVLAALLGSDLILHAGDVGGPEVIAALAALAPVHAVRGNNDQDPFGVGLPLTRVVEVGEVSFHLVHELRHLDRPTANGRPQVVVSGHSHRHGAEEVDGVLYLNPGSIGPRRFTLPVTLAQVTIRGAAVEHEIVELDV